MAPPRECLRLLQLKEAPSSSNPGEVDNMSSQLMSKIIFIYRLRSLPFSIAIHYPSPYKSRSGIFKQAIQFVYLS